MSDAPTENTETLTGGQISDIVCAALDLNHTMFLEQTRIAGWQPDRWRAELAEPGWPERFTAELEAARRRDRVAAELASALTTGPSALAGLSDHDLLARIDPRLHRLATELDPVQHGGRLICGPTETGKTTACVLVLRRHIRTQVDAIRDAANRTGERWRTSVKLGIACGWARALDLPTARLGHGLGDGEPEAIDDAKRVPILVLDDLGWESRRAGADDVLPEVLAHRYDHGRVTIVTTGLRPEQVSERYSEAFTRRILQAGGKPGRVIDLWPKEEGK